MQRSEQPTAPRFRVRVIRRRTALNSAVWDRVKTRDQRPHARRPAAIQVSDNTLGRLADIFKLLGDKSRLKILLALAQDNELHVSALCELLDQSQPAVSHHLTLLRMTGLVGYRRS